MKKSYTVGKGAEVYLKDLEKIAKDSPHLIGMAIFEGAKIVTDEIRRGIESIPTHRGFRRAQPGETIDTISEAQKRGLLNGLGIAEMKNDGGTFNVKIGMDGYNTVVTNQWPHGQPNALIMRSVESGTSFMRKNPVISKAVRATKSQAEDKMGKVIDDQLKKRISN